MFARQTKNEGIHEGWDRQCQPRQVYIDGCKKIRSNETSKDLQQQLVTYYQNNAHPLNALSRRFSHLHLPHIDPWYKFGITQAMRGNLVAMAQLDVQDEGLINDYIQQFENGNATLPHSTCRRLYVDYTLRKIQGAFGEIVQTQSTGAWILGSIKKYFLQQPKSVLSDLEHLHQNAKTTLALCPDLEKKHVDILINIKLELARQLKEAGELCDIPLLYREAFSLIAEDPSSPKAYDYMNRYFLEEGAFATLDVNGQFVQAWGEHLLRQVLPSAPAGEKKSLCAYHIAQMRADLISSDSLEFYIDSCLHAKDYKLAARLIERFSEVNIDRSVKYVSEHSSKLSSFLHVDTPLSQAYAKQLVHDSESYLARFSFFGHISHRIDKAATMPSIKKDTNISGANIQVLEPGLVDAIKTASKHWFQF